jgi:3-hydroxyisobutyrate dehydrogenase-like beta-hydroxyacid dehydrogenase
MTSTVRDSVAFLGTGLMGRPMAQNLARAGFRVRAWNRTPDKATGLEGQLSIAASPAEAAQGAAICVVMVSDGPACAEVLFGPSGAAGHLQPGAVVVVMSTIGHAEALELAQQTRAAGLGWVDAPVSGGTVAAEAATLSIMAGGEAADVDVALPVLKAMGNSLHLGPAGAGTLTKLINQMVVASTIATIAEAMTLARQGGAELAKVREALLGGFAQSRILDLHGQRMIADNFAPGGPARYQLKDTRAARAAAGALGLELPVLDLVDTLFADLVAHGDGDLDHAALIHEIRRRNHIGGSAD